MNDSIKKSLVSLLESSVVALKNKDILRLRELNEVAIKNASIFQDEDSLSFAVILYSITKIMERGGFDGAKAAVLFYHSKRHLEKGNFKLFKAEIKKLFKLIADTDKRLNIFIEEVIQQAQIKKGSGLHEHGISAGQASSLLGVSLWDLMSYVGKTSSSEMYPQKVDVRKRMETTRGLFR